MKKRKKLLLCYTAAFFLPLAACILVFFLKKVTPFGNNCLLNFDLWNGYLSLFSQEDGTVFLSEDGTVFLSIEAFLRQDSTVTQSWILNDSVFFTAAKLLSSGMVARLYSWFCLLALGLGSVSCYTFLRFRIGKCQSFLIAGAAAYSLSSWALAFLTKPGWIGGMIAAPLVLLGEERLIRKKKGFLYTLTLAFCFLINAEIGVGTAIFCFGWYLCSALSQGKKALKPAEDTRIRENEDDRNDRENIESKENKEGEENTGSTESTESKEFERSRENRVPAYRTQARRWGLDFLLFLVYTLLAAAIAAVTLIPAALEVQSAAGTSASGWIGSLQDILKQMLPGQGLQTQYDGLNISAGIWILVFIPLYFCNVKIAKRERAIAGLFLGAVAAVLLSAKCGFLWHGVLVSGQYAGNAAFLLILLAILLGCRGFSMREGLTPFCVCVSTVNSVLLILMGYSGSLSKYALPFLILAAAECLLILFLVAGSRSAKKVRVCVTVAAALILADSMSNFVWIAVQEQDGLETAAISDYVQTEGHLVGEDNPMAVPAAFVVSEGAESWTVKDQARAVQSQNILLKRIGGVQDVFERMGASLFSFSNCSLSDNEYWDLCTFQTTNLNEAVVFSYVWDCGAAGTIYLENNFRAGTITVESKNGTVSVTSPEDTQYLCLGEYEEGDEISVSVSVEGVQGGCCGLNLYRVNEENWKAVCETMNDGALRIFQYSRGKINGRITTETGEMVLIALPQAGDWTVWCDGETVEPEMLSDNLMAVRMEAGSHILTLDGRAVSGASDTGTGPVIISLAGCVALAVLTVFQRKRRTKDVPKA